MSKRLKNELTQLFQMVCNGLNIIKEPIQQENRIAYLTSMQDAVICIGTKMEKVVPGCEAFVGQLSMLAENFYQLSQGVELDFKIWQNTKELCAKIQKEMKQVLPDKYEILFLPYKISMWDSLESVYTAAIKNEECEVRVMPVPYYHVNENRTELEMTYEGGEFAKHVSITDYQKYAIEDNLPDVIFIHNPYDDTNRVTSLSERYFSRELKKYTDHLVYIPYKVCSGNVKDIYCMTPGVNNAWRVYVQSERVRTTYMKYQNPDKIIVTGSPKIDAVIAGEKRTAEIPLVWEKALHGRKVFLLNTHLNTLINEGERVIEKITHLMKVFSQRCSAAILWRPHPLSIETIKSMNPEILEDYQKLISEFQKLENGVYDDTNDPHLALAIADGYIGDWSSLVTMFGITGKPIYIWNMSLPESEQKRLDIESEEGVRQLKKAAEQQRLHTIYMEKDVELETFVEAIMKEIDPLKTHRKEEFQNIVFDAEGKAGELIWENVWQDLQ